MKDEFRTRRLKDIAASYDEDGLTALVKKHGSPLFVINKKEVVRGYKAMVEIMPQATPYFAVKSCPVPELLAIYKELGACLDVATSGELDILEALGYPAEFMIHTHPHKKEEDIKRAYAFGIRNFVFDTIEELDKLEAYKNTVMLSLRLAFPNKHAGINLSYKFGLQPDEAFIALKTALDRGFKVPCVCFHVGSQLNNVSVFDHALRVTAVFCTRVHEKLSHTFSVLDIGGGFPAAYTSDVTSIEEFAMVVNPLLDELFQGFEIRSEPGRYLVNSSVFALTSVVTASKRNGTDWLYIDDGIYGTFANMVHAKTPYNFYSLKELTGVPATVPYTIGGPTCDSLDVVAEDTLLPPLNQGDILMVPDAGAYSWTLATNFNSIAKPKIVVV